MRLVADVTIQHGEVGGPPVGKSHLHKGIGVELIATGDGLPALSLAIKSGKGLVLPIAPPLTLHAHCVSSGRLGLRFLRFRPNAWSRVEKTLQININVGLDADRTTIDGLSKLHSRLHSILASGTWSCGVQANPARFRRPLAPRNLNTSPSIIPSTVLETKENRMYVPPSTARPAMLQCNNEELPALSDEQSRAVHLVKQGSSIFFTGCAGTGKSLLLRHIVKVLPPDTTFVTGTTGMASSLLGGTTINSFAGIGRCDVFQPIDIGSLVRSAAKGDSGYRWRKVKTLIIDEVSMMDGRLFDVLETIARRVRGIDRPFGGIQLVVSGDFHQLPPIAARGSTQSPQHTRRFAFEAESWSRCISVCIELRTVFRQADAEFIKLLSQVRQGRVEHSMLSMLQSRCSGPLDVDDGILPTSLFTHRADVEMINQRQLQALEGNVTTYNARDSGDVAVLNTSCPAPCSLCLKVGAQVMLTKNISAKHKLVNGSRGVVERFTPGSKLPMVRFAAQSDELVTVEREKFTVSHGGRVLATRLQIPLALAWAITVHKSQGLTLDRVEVSLERAFEPGMAYVALSRAKSFEGLRVVGGIPASVLVADPKVVEFYASASKFK